ncbi:hypothetical protein [Streptomyces cavourensis]|uniref:hypothetical protein n=1 Tax=Streptomyces cavourensis TaxID=67258 RepID=UPI0013C2ECB9|nr:hypothetical protein [Streptomyces cavourensis]
MAIIILGPFLALFGLAEVEKSGFRGIGIHLTAGIIFAAIARGAIGCKIVLDQNGSVRGVGPVVETIFSGGESMSVKCENNGLMIVHSGREYGVWSFSQSAIGGRSARSARGFIDSWLKGDGRQISEHASSVERRVYLRPTDVLLLVVPFVVPLLMRL